MLNTQIHLDQWTKQDSEEEVGGKASIVLSDGCATFNISQKFKDDRIDFYLIRKAHLQFMTRTKRVIGLQEVRNLADITCDVLRDEGVSTGDINLMRYRMLRINIMQISGYFIVDQEKFERDGVSHLIDAELCKKLIRYAEAQFDQIQFESWILKTIGFIPMLKTFYTTAKKLIVYHSRA